MKLYASGEDYLEAILILQRKKPLVRSVDLSQYMNVSKPSVSHAVGLLRKGRLLIVGVDHGLYLTEAGRKIAENVYEKHQFFSALLIAAGTEPALAEKDACRLEHAISEPSFQKLKKYLSKEIAVT